MALEVKQSTLVKGTELLSLLVSGLRAQKRIPDNIKSVDMRRELQGYVFTWTEPPKQ